MPDGPTPDRPAPAAEPDPDRWGGVLSAAARRQVVRLAADALGALPLADVPPTLRPFVRFVPARRARLAATPLAAAVDEDPAFRAQVAHQVRQVLPDLATAVADGRLPPAAEPALGAAVAYLLRPPGWPDLVVAVEQAGQAESGADRQLAQTVERLTEQLRAARATAREQLARARAELDAARGQAQGLRAQVQRARAETQQARQAARTAEAALRELRAESAGASTSMDAELRRLRARVAELEQSLEDLRRGEREGRAVADLRLRLLLDTLVGVVDGVRRELALPPVTCSPADQVTAVVPPAPGVGDVAVRGRDREDPDLLDELLRLPRVHLVVDGYNVTKAGYPTLPLAEQRARLLRGLTGLAARTGAEVTCVFDGAELAGPVPAVRSRGVRTLFSPAGETADELIARLVRAEPAGRPLVVVSSDREVAAAAAAAGARPMPSPALLRRLERG